MIWSAIFRYPLGTIASFQIINQLVVLSSIATCNRSFSVAIA
jgi:hypothetical protein